MIQSLDHNFQDTIYTRRKTAFTLIEIMIVVAILGIIAAIVLPEFQTHSQQAKEAAAKETLRIFREVIERYASKHNDLAPGYPLDRITLTPMLATLKQQLITSSEPYLSGFPQNPFNNSRYILVIRNTTDFPAAPEQTDYYGWIYKPLTKTIKLNWPGTDSEGKEYFSY